jgi:hypothetical protein
VTSTLLSDGTPANTGQEVLRYTNPNGGFVDLNVGTGSFGRFMPPVQTYEDGSPVQPGSTLRDVQYQPRILNLNLSVPGGGQRTLLRLFSQVLNPRLGVGTLKAISGRGVGRHLECIYLAGLETIVEDNPSYSYGVVQFKCFNPFYLDDNPTILTYSPGVAVPYNWRNVGGSGLWFPNHFGTSSSVNLTQTVNNVGDVESWPFLTLFGDGNAFTITNLTTGQTFSIQGGLALGETLSIDMRYGKKTVLHTDTLGNTTNWYSHIVNGTQMWYLEPGQNQIQISYTSVAGSVQFGYVPQYLTP